MFKVELENEYKGYKYVVVFNGIGHRCGYVGVPKSHKLYGITYSEKMDYLKKSDLENEEIGKRGIIPLVFSSLEKGDTLSLDVYLNVHGSLTYSGGDKNYPVPSDLWWFGFDCGHAGDDPDYDTAYDYGLIKEEEYRVYKGIEKRFGSFGEKRSLEYTEQECKNLIDQIEVLNGNN